MDRGGRNEPGQEDIATFQNAALSAHNRYRKHHGVGALRLSDDLCAHAQQWAEHLAAIGTLQHSKRASDVGENIASFFGSQNADTGQQATDQWYSEVNNFDFANSDYQSGTGHFTQVVWKDSQEFGIGKAVSSRGGVFVVANYRPAGNMLGRYQENVFSPTKGEAVTGALRGSAGHATGPVGRDLDGDRDRFYENKHRDDGTGVATTQFQQEALRVHNEYRSKHGVDSLSLSDDLCKSAQDWAEHLAQTGRLEHSKRRDAGENVAMRYSSATTAYSGKDVCDTWYSELSKYNFEKTGFSSGTGHFTQMVWKGSREFGIGKAVSSDGKVMVVGQYRPPGNIVGRYEGNVFPRSDSYVPSHSAAQTSKVTRVVRNTQYVTEQSPENVTRKVGGLSLQDPDLSPSDLGSFQRNSLEAHNKHRARHGARGLRASGELSRRAQDWAAHLAKKDEFKNSGDSDVGENIAMHYSSASTAFSGEEATDMFYRQISKYNFNNPKFVSGAGHFTQLVWKDTEEFGIGKAITKEGKVIVVAFYRPPGNVMGQFDTQVSEVGK